MTTDTTYGTDRGPACACGGTVYSYQLVDDGMVRALCIGCHGTLRFRCDAADIRQIRETHEAYVLVAFIADWAEAGR